MTHPCGRRRPSEERKVTVIPATPINAPQATTSEPPLNEEEFAALASFRKALREFLAFSEHAAAEQGATMQWYQALLVIRTNRADQHISVGELAEQLMIKDHSAAELVSRLVQARLVKRYTDPDDRRRSLLVMTKEGDERLTILARAHLDRLRANKAAFLNLFGSAEPTFSHRLARPAREN